MLDEHSTHQKCPNGDVYYRSALFIYCTLTGLIWVFLFSCFLPGSIQWKYVLSEPLCAYRTPWHWWITRCGCEPARTWASWASSYSSETSSTFQWCKWRHPSYSSKKQEQLCAWSAFSFNMHIPWMLPEMTQQQNVKMKAEASSANAIPNHLLQQDWIFTEETVTKLI